MEKVILVVDDSPTTRKIVSMIVEEMGHRVVTASDGFEAISLLENTCVDMIITNLNMPHYNGYQLIDAIRKEYKDQQIPILIMSSEDHFDQIQKGYRLGADAYLIKPFVPEVLQNEIRKWLQKSE